MKRITFLFILIFATINAQEKRDSLKVKKNPILYTSSSLGYVAGSLKGFNASFDLNYQSNKDLFTFKYGIILDIQDIGIVFYLPYLEINTATEQFSLLYGKRYIKGGFSYHFSGGISYNITDDLTIDKKYNYFGFPLEIGVYLFKSKKSRFRILSGLIPVGNPTGLGRSFGFKLHANIAKKSYIGFGLNYGFGWHKKY